MVGVGKTRPVSGQRAVGGEPGKQLTLLVVLLLGGATTLVVDVVLHSVGRGRVLGV